MGSLALRPFGLLPALAQTGSSDYRALVCVFLFGGNDSNNLIVPMDDVRYQQYLLARGQLGLQGSDLTAPVTAKTGQVPYAFHAGLEELAGLFSDGALAVAANVGSLVKPLTRADLQSASVALPDNLFWHYDQEQQWQSAVSTGSSTSGWAGRVADLASSQNSTKFPTFLSVAGSVSMGSGIETHQVALNAGSSLDLPGFDASTTSQIRRSALENLLTFNTGFTLAQAANGVLSDGIADAKLLGSALQNANLKAQFPATGLGAQLQQIAQVIKVRDSIGMRRQIFFCSMGGFDTHANELDTQAGLYPQLSQALNAFMNAMQELGTENNVTTFTESDFSRTLQPNSTLGTDHAWGGHHLVLGGAVKGNDIYGKFPSLVLGGPDDTDMSGRWIPSISIEQYGATLCSWFGIRPSDLAKVFPNLSSFSSAPLGFLG